MKPNPTATREKNANPTPPVPWLCQAMPASCRYLRNQRNSLRLQGHLRPGTFTFKPHLIQTQLTTFQNGVYLPHSPRINPNKNTHRSLALRCLLPVEPHPTGIPDVWEEEPGSQEAFCFTCVIWRRCS